MLNALPALTQPTTTLSGQLEHNQIDALCNDASQSTQSSKEALENSSVSSYNSNLFKKRRRSGNWGVRMKNSNVEEQQEPTAKKRMEGKSRATMNKVENGNKIVQKDEEIKMLKNNVSDNWKKITQQDAILSFVSGRVNYDRLSDSLNSKIEHYQIERQEKDIYLKIDALKEFRAEKKDRRVDILKHQDEIISLMKTLIETIGSLSSELQNKIQLAKNVVSYNFFD